MNTVGVRYETRPADTPQEPASVRWVVVPMPRSTQQAWAKGRVRPKLTRKAFLDGMATVIQFPSLFPKRK